MSGPRPRHYPRQRRPRRERFADGSAVVTYAEGSMAILEGPKAKATGIADGGPVHYGSPPPRLRRPKP